MPGNAQRTRSPCLARALRVEGGVGGVACARSNSWVEVDLGGVRPPLHHRSRRRHQPGSTHRLRVERYRKASQLSGVQGCCPNLDVPRRRVREVCLGSQDRPLLRELQAEEGVGSWSGLRRGAGACMRLDPKASFLGVTLVEADLIGPSNSLA